MRKPIDNSMYFGPRHGIYIYIKRENELGPGQRSFRYKNEETMSPKSRVLQGRHYTLGRFL
jgi:hypothetical protein